MKSEPAAGCVEPALLLAGPESPTHTADWLGSDFADDFFRGTGDLDLPSALSGGNEGLLDDLSETGTLEILCNGDVLEAGSDREMIMAEAAAAGLHRSGMRRHAYSTGDLQALQPDPDEAPLSIGPPPSSVFRMGSMALRAPRLESVPEGSVSHLPSSSAATDRPAAAEQLSSMSMSQLQTELDCSKAAYRSAPVSSALTGFETTPAHVLSTCCLIDSGPTSSGQTQDFGAILMQHGCCLADEWVQPPRAGTGTPLSSERGLLHRPMGRSQSAVELHLLSNMSRAGSSNDLRQFEQVTVELMTPEGHVYRVGRLSAAERAQKILKYRQKRHERNFTKRIKYQCRKTLADSRPRVRGRFARNDDAGAVLPHETKKALAAKTCKSARFIHGMPAADSRPIAGDGGYHKPAFCLSELLSTCEATGDDEAAARQHKRRLPQAPTIAGVEQSDAPWHRNAEN